MLDMLELCNTNKYDTDKYLSGTTFRDVPHCYVEHVYSKVFERIRLSAKNVLEIGIYRGGSALLWRDYFPNATVYGIDINEPPSAIRGEPRIVPIVHNAYEAEFAAQFRDNHFDMILDDGPHTPESMRKFLSYYSSKLKSDGVMVVEDIPEIGLAESLATECFYRKYAKVYDLRYVSNKKDDIVLVIDLGDNNG